MLHQVTVSATGESFACAEDVNVLAAMERSRCRAIPVGCRNGGCGVCKVRVTAGRFHTAKMNRAAVSATEEEQGCALACKLYPREDICVQVLGRVWEQARPTARASFSFGFAETASNSQPAKET